jgi:2-phospho-L-lactate/phosphoenolpyruvate guanylyltransferase
MCAWTLVPIRGFSASKSRLQSVLPLPARRALNVGMLERVLEAVEGASDRAGHNPLAQCIVISPDAETLTYARFLGAQTLAEKSGIGLNAALTLGRAYARMQGAKTLLVLAADLPNVDADALVRLYRAVPEGTAAVIADKSGYGTNGLVLPASVNFVFSFGERSFFRHCAGLERLGVSTQVWRDPGLAFDLDTAFDLVAWKAAQAGAD